MLGGVGLVLNCLQVQLQNLKLERQRTNFLWDLS